jgi:hypothetical protein
LYKQSRTRGPLRQAELLSSVSQVTVRPTSLLAGRRLVTDVIQHDWAIIASQDCDLDWDFAARFPDPARTVKNKELPNILLCETRRVPEGARLPEFDKDIWRRVSQNQDERYYLLPALSADRDRLGEGVDSLLVDFKRHFTISTPELYQRLALRHSNVERAERRAELESPHREDFCSRFVDFLSRVALPDDYA